jgi:uncharacterized protein (TIGR00369 family)
MTLESDDDRFRRVAKIFASASFLDLLGIRLEQVGPDWVETSLTVKAAHQQQHGYVHAGVITTLADHTAGAAARAAVAPGFDVLTLDLKINFLLPGRASRLEARGRTLRAGRRIAVSESEVFEVDGAERRLIAKCMSTLTVLEERPFASVK